MRLTVDEIVLRPGISHFQQLAPYESCARCSQYHRLVRVGRLWMQPEHDCRLEEEKRSLT
jgi:hypothetical protein